MSNKIQDIVDAIKNPICVENDPFEYDPYPNSILIPDPPEEDQTHPTFLTLTEYKELINCGLPVGIWHKINNAISIMETGQPYCEEMV